MNQRLLRRLRNFSQDNIDFKYLVRTFPQNQQMTRQRLAAFESDTKILTNIVKPFFGLGFNDSFTYKLSRWKDE